MLVVSELPLLSWVPIRVQPVDVACTALSLELMTMSITSPFIVPEGTLTEVFAVALQVAAEARYATAASADGTLTKATAARMIQGIKPTLKTRPTFVCIELCMIDKIINKLPVHSAGSISSPSLQS